MTRVHFFSASFSMPSLFLFAAALALPVLSGCGSETKATAKSEGKSAAPAVLVRTAEVERIELAEPVHATGLLAASEESKLSFKISGIIDRVFVKEGQNVAKGQLLATLKLSEVNAQVSQARSGFEKAERDLKRVKNLYDDKVATNEQLQDATTGYDVAKSSLTIAKFNQQYASIYAPVSGKVLKKFAEENELITAGTPLVMLSNASQGWVVKIGLADRDAVRVRLGDKATVAFDAYPAATFTGVVSEIAGAATPQTGTFDTQLRLDASNLKLLSGMAGKAEVLPSQKQPVALVPVESFVEGNERRGFIYAMKQNTVKKIAVQVAFIHHNQLAIERGLENVKTVVTDGASYLSDSATVQVAP